MASLLLLLLLGVGGVSATPMGLFVSTQDFGDGSTAYGRTVTAALQLACDRFNASTSPNRITSLALDHLTDAAGAYLEAPLAALAPYFGCFGALYVGTADNHFAGSQSDLYCGALANATFTTEYVRRSLRAAARFHAARGAALPHLRWYLNYEAAGNYFGTGCTRFEVAQPADPPGSHPGDLPPALPAAAFTAAYASMFAALTEGLVAIRDTSILWSPTFNWQASFVGRIGGGRAALVANLTLLLRTVPLLREIANQDAVGKYSLYDVGSRSFSYNLTCADTVFYQTLLAEAARDAVATPAATPAAAPAGAPAAAAAAPASVSVNMELFSRRNTVPPSTIAGDPAEHEARKCCYRAHNLALGPSWDARFWYASQFVEWDPDPPVEEDEL